MQSTSGINIVVTLVRRGLGNTAAPSIGMSLRRELSRITMKSMEKADPEVNEEMDEEVDFDLVVDPNG